MKTCESFAALLDPFVDGELSPEEMQAVRAHLEKCPDCRAYVEDALAIRAEFPGVEETVVPQGFAEGVMAAVQAQPAAGRKQKKQPWSKILLPLAACFAVVLVLKTAVGPMGSGENSAPEARVASGETAVEFAMSEETAEAAPEAEAPAEVMDETAEPETAADSRAESRWFVHARLDAREAGALLDGFEPVREEPDAWVYELSAEDYGALLEALAAEGVVPAEEEPAEGAGGALALVTVLK